MNYSSNDIHRFWNKVMIKGEDECWEWQAGKIKGYGLFYIKRQPVLAHRFSYFLATNQIPLDMDVLHECDNPSCVNPKHLWLGTHQENMQDRDTKGRVAHGETSGAAKLSQAQVTKIRQRWQRRKKKWGLQTQLAEEFGVTQRQISNIVRAKQRI